MSETVLRATLDWSRERDYIGYDKVDGLSSRLYRRLPVDNRVLGLLVQESVKRAPVNIRPFMLVERRRNFKGAALFALANFDAYDLFGDRRYRQDAQELCRWLLENQSEEYPEFCGGHQHPIQRPKERIPAGSPGVVSTAYGVRALHRYAEYDPTVTESVRSGAEFVRKRLNPVEADDGIAIRYKTSDGDDVRVLNANALGARILTDAYDLLGDESYRETARGILEYVVSRQSDNGGWAFTDPPEASHRSMDNYHNGFIVESLHRYGEVTGSDRFDEPLDRALSFYRTVLYEDDGAPNWTERQRYPRDVHSAAQGIVTFSLSGDVEFATRILKWTLETLYAGDGQFYYQKRLGYTKKFTLMRWCQAWMAYALGVYCVKCQDDDVETVPAPSLSD